MPALTKNAAKKSQVPSPPTEAPNDILEEIISKLPNTQVVRGTTKDEKETKPPVVQPTERSVELNTSYFESTDKDAWSLDKFKECQANRTDPEMIPVYERLEGSNPKPFEIRDGLVTVLDKKSGKPKIVVPESLKAFILGMHHGLPLTGHPGRNRTLNLIRKRYWWKGLNGDVRRWVRACHSCGRRKTPRPLNVGLTQPMHQSRPFHTVAIDIVGPCLETTNGHMYILTMIDVFTRYPIAIPIPNRKASTIMFAIYEHIVCHYGIPTRILSDRAKEFIDTGAKALCERWGISKIETSGYNSTGNGHVERFHRYLNAAMTISYDKRSKDWDIYLPAILFAYRVTTNDSTGFSPAYLMYGRELMLTSDIIFDTTSLTEKPFSSEKEYVIQLQSALESAFGKARDAQMRAAKTNAIRRDKSRIEPPPYKHNDKVWYWARSNAEHRVTLGDNDTVSLRDK